MAFSVGRVAGRMKQNIWLCLAFLIVSCSSPAKPQPLASSLAPTAEVTQTPASTVTSALVSTRIAEVTPSPPSAATPDILGTLIAKGPSIEVTFDGHNCTVGGSTEIMMGEQVIVLYNQSGQNAYLYVARRYPGKTWQDVLDDIGTPGSTAGEPKEVAIMRWDHLVFADSIVSYRQYTFKFEGGYHIVVQGHGEYYGIWPCGPFDVVAAPTK
jgi:hypothetical protein